MKCARCQKPINRGTELTKAITVYKWPTDHAQAGQQIEVGFDREYKTAPPNAKLVKAYHFKCYKIAEKRENRGGDAVTGRAMGSIPTAYEIGQLTMNESELELLGLSVEEAKGMDTASFTKRVQEQRIRAKELGTGVQDWRFQEWERAREHDGPYYHAHTMPIADFKLEVHLHAAHGVTPAEQLTSLGGKRGQHNEAHAKMELEKTQASRSQDPGYNPPHEADWREQKVMEL